MINWINSNMRFHHKSITWEKSMFGVTPKLLMAYKSSLFSLLILSTKEHVWSLGVSAKWLFLVHVLFTQLCQNFGNPSHMYTSDTFIKTWNFFSTFFFFNFRKQLNFLFSNTTKKVVKKWVLEIFVRSKLGHS